MQSKTKCGPMLHGRRSHKIALLCGRDRLLITAVLAFVGRPHRQWAASLEPSLSAMVPGTANTTYVGTEKRQAVDGDFLDLESVRFRQPQFWTSAARTPTVCPSHVAISADDSSQQW